MERMRYTIRLGKTRPRGKEGSASQSTDRRSYFGGDNVQNTLSYLAAVQMHERFLCDIKASPGGVNGSNDDGHARRCVGQAPAPAAVGRVPHDVEGTTDERERRNIAKRRESSGQAVRTVRARNVVERTFLVIVRGVEGRFKGGRGR